MGWSFAVQNTFGKEGGLEAPVLWGLVAKYVLWKAEEKWKTRESGGLLFGGTLDGGHFKTYDVV